QGPEHQGLGTTQGMQGVARSIGPPPRRRRGRMTTITRKTNGNSKRSRPRASDWKVLKGADRIRWSRIQTAQARIVSGYYDRDDVQRGVVSEILKERKRH